MRQLLKRGEAKKSAFVEMGEQNNIKNADEKKIAQKKRE